MVSGLMAKKLRDKDCNYSDVLITIYLKDAAGITLHCETRQSWESGLSLKQIARHILKAIDGIDV